MINFTMKELKNLVAAFDVVTDVPSEERKELSLTPNDPATIASLAAELLAAKQELAAIDVDKETLLEEKDLVRVSETAETQAHIQWGSVIVFRLAQTALHHLRRREEGMDKTN